MAVHVLFESRLANVRDTQPLYKIRLIHGKTSIVSPAGNVMRPLQPAEDRGEEAVDVVLGQRRRAVLGQHHLHNRLGAEVVDPYIVALLNLNAAELAVVGLYARLVIVVEPRVEAGAEDIDGARVDDACRPRDGALIGEACAVLRRRVVGEDTGPERARRCGCRLEVGRLGLDHAHEDVGRVGELVLVQHRVLRRRAPEICKPALHKHAAACVNVQLAEVGAVQVVVRHPRPHVLDVGGRVGLEVKHDRGRLAVLHGGGGALGTVSVLQIGASGTSDTNMRV